MNKSDLKILKQYRTLSPIDRHHITTLEHFEKLKLIEINHLYTTTIKDVCTKYARTTEHANDILDSFKWYKKIPLIKLLFK